MKTFKNSQSLAAIEQEKEHAALTSIIILQILLSVFFRASAPSFLSLFHVPVKAF
jgi:hypothetical protein